MSTMRRRPYVTTRTHEVFAIAHDLADRLGHDDVTPVHVSLGLLREGMSVAVWVLHSHGVPLDVFERELEAHLPPPGAPHVPADERSWTLSDERIIEQAIAEARELGTEFFSCEHVLLAFLRDASSAPAQLLAEHGVRYDDARKEVLRAYNAGPEGWTSASPSPGV
jgi:ATP-dependent Clp protease ATP-binding subunit ClpA